MRNSLGADVDDSDTSGWVESDSSLADAQLTGNYERQEGMVTKVPYSVSCYSICRSGGVGEGDFSNFGRIISR